MRRLIVPAIAALTLAVLTPTPAAAQATTTFVSGAGLDANPCTVTAPCRSFQHAHDMTAAGGQVTMLEPAGYGAVTITKAISIVNDGGGEAGISDPGAGNDAITINAGAGDVVNLRGLTLNGVGTGHNGINVTAVGTLNIQNCVIRDFTNDGVLATLAASAAVTITDTIVSNNGLSGVTIAPSSGTVTASLAWVTAIANGSGGPNSGGVVLNSFGGVIQAGIVDSAAIGNNSAGFSSVTGGGTITLINSKAVRNVTGLVATTGTYLSKMTLAGNVVGFFAGGATLKTFGDNYIIDTNNTGTLSPIAEQ